MSWYPRLLHPLARQAVYALLDERLRRAFGYPKAARVSHWLVHGGLRLAGVIMRFLPPRRRPFLLTKQSHRSYPEGYQLEQLGPP